MCEIFPEVEDCCFCFTLRIGMLFIAVLSITTGSLTLSTVEIIAGANHQKNMQAFSEVSKAANTLDSLRLGIVSQFTNLTVLFTSIQAISYMLAGFFLLYANLVDEEGYAQLFVWLIFLNVILGMFTIVMVIYECMTKDPCIMKMDWLSVACWMTIWFCFLLIWLYFISVANSYVLNGDSPS